MTSASPTPPLGPAIPASVRALMAEVGPRWATNVPGHVRQMIEAFGPVLERAPKDGVTARKNLAYGTDPRHVLDAYLPQGVSAAPVVVFVHGGAFVDGEKDRSAEVYSNVGWYLARHGVAVLNIEYRLAPAATYPGGTADVALAAQWAVNHAQELGLDPTRLFLFGHSAGAAHAAACAYGAPGSELAPPIAGLIVVSGRVRADNRPDNPNARKVEAYYGTDASQFETVSALHWAKASMPTFIAIAEFENPLLDIYCLELAHKLASQLGRAPRIVQRPGHNHTSIIAHLNTADDVLGSAIRAFISHPR